MATATPGRAHSIRVLRASQWAHFALLPAAAVDPAALDLAGALRLAVAAVVAGGALGFAYGINALADRHSDRSAAKNPLAGQPSIDASAVLAVALAGTVALAGAAWLGVVAMVAATVSLLCGALYSARPRLKSIPLVGIVGNTGIFAPLLFVAADGTLPPHFALLAITFTALLLQNQLLHELADADEDAVAGDLTTARMLGPAATVWLVGALAVAGGAAVLATASAPAPATTAAVVLAAATLAGVGRGSAAQRRRWHRWLSLAGGAALYLSTLVAS